MKKVSMVSIVLTQEAVGNPRRGYHAYTSLVTFVYEGDSQYAPEREQEIVRAMLGSPWRPGSGA